MVGLRIVFFGTPQFAVPTLSHLLQSRHTVCGVVTQPDRPRGRGQKVSDAPVKALALAHHLPVLQPERLRDAAVAEAIAGWKPDLGVVAAYGKLIPEALLLIPRLGMINVHGSLLPKYRGAAPIHRAVIAGETETGVTIMRVVKALDAGAMFATVTRPIGIEDTSEDVERDLAERGAALLVQVADAIEDGTAREEPQEDSRATYAAKISRGDGAIDWAATAAQIHNQVRGLYPWPHAFTFLDGARIIVLKTRVETPRPADAGHHDDEAGTVVAVSREAIVVATGGGGWLAILELQPEGKRPMPARDFIAGRALQPGVRLGA
jgi:methionyl-tRNA formyltransferase